jgi:GNAT superfamily N-acetyltransferase
MAIRDALATEVDQLAAIWHDGWHEAHAHLVPGELTRLRTIESFRERLHGVLTELRVAGPPGQPVGFCLIKGDELYQLFVAAQGRGTGEAAALLRDAEVRLAGRGVARAWLACAIGNDRAARFYEKCGWVRRGIMINEAETSRGPFPLEVWRYEKQLA